MDFNYEEIRIVKFKDEHFFLLTFIVMKKLNEMIEDGNDNAILSEEEAEALFEGLKQESTAKVKSHDEMLEKHRKQFPHLKGSLLNL